MTCFFFFFGAAFMTLYAAEPFPFKQERCRSEWFHSDTTMINRRLTCTCYQRSAFLKRLRKCGQCYYCAFLIGHSVFCIHEKLEINVLGTCIHRKGSGMPQRGSPPPPPQHFQQFLCSVAYPLTSSMIDNCFFQLYGRPLLLY